MSFVVFGLKASIFLSVLAIGLKSATRDATYLLRRPEALGRALLSMNGIMVLFAVLVVTTFDLNPSVRLALLALAVAPIPPLLPRKVLKAGGAHAYTIGLLVASALLSIVFIPLAIEIFQRISGVPLEMPATSVIPLVLLTVLLPLAIGIAVRTLKPELAERSARPVGEVATGLLLVSAVLLLAAAWRPMISLIGNGTLAAFIGFCLVGLFVGHLLGGPASENRTVLAMATAARHPGIAIAVVHVNFPGAKLAPAAVLLFLIVNAIVSGIYLAWRRRHPPSLQVAAHRRSRLA